MEKRLMFWLRSVIMVFSLIGIFCLLFSSCWKSIPENMNQIFIENSTNDTLKFQVTRKYITDSVYDLIDIIPGSNRVFGNQAKSTLRILQDEWKYRGDTVEIYRAGYLPIKWAAPLREMDDTIHHFFNENSWEITIGGHNDEWEVATFTLTEEDFVKIQE